MWLDYEARTLRGRRESKEKGVHVQNTEGDCCPSPILHASLRVMVASQRERRHQSRSQEETKAFTSFALELLA